MREPTLNHPAFLRIQDASDRQFSNGMPVRSKEMFLGWHAEQIQSRNIARVWAAPGHVKLLAHINHGRWLVHCAACPQAMWTHPEWKIACCTECGAVYEGIIFPFERPVIEQILLMRWVENQNWEPGETVADLQRENMTYRKVG